jgi:hypothetical protein
MVENEAEVVNTEVNTEIQAQPEQEVPEQVDVSPKESVLEQPKKVDHKNFRALREEKERIEREHYQMRLKLEEIEKANKKPVQEEEYDADLQFDPDGLIEGKQFNKATKKLLEKQKALEKQLEAYQTKTAAMTAETRLKSEYPDFDKVVTKDNIEVLKLMKPGLARSLDANPDLYDKAESAYTMIKALGIDQNGEEYEKDHEVAKKNLSKPRPAIGSQQGDSPLAMANVFASGLTDDMRKQLYNEMIEAKNNKGFI